MFHKSLTREEVLELILMTASKTIPEGIEGDISAEWNNEDGIDIFLYIKVNEKDLN